MRVIAVDWSGAARGAHRKICLAEVRDGTLTRIESGRTRDQITEHLVELAGRDPDLVVGLDFAFSFPRWYLEERGLDSVRELWSLADREGEDWLDRCDPPFWGRPGKPRPDLPAHYRRTEERIRDETDGQPKSPFQIGGAGAVGTASIRGMPHLSRLDRAGFSIWPFDPPTLPLVVEIYPRVLTGSVRKSVPEERRIYLAENFSGVEEDRRARAAESEHAFDAVVSALVTDRHREEFRVLDHPGSRTVRREGRIWRPGVGVGADHRTGSAQLQKGLRYATRIHAGQTRKDPEGTPYIAHLLGVCSLALEAGADEEQAVAALLHDAVEDQGGRERLSDIREQFGHRVAGIVEACTDSFTEPRPDWRPRKQRYVGEIPEKSPDALLVICADKLYNARTILTDHHRVGGQVFERFTGGKDGTLWYCRAVAEALARSPLTSWLVEELERTVETLEREAAQGSSGPPEGR